MKSFGSTTLLRVHNIQCFAKHTVPLQLVSEKSRVNCSVAEPHHFYAAPAPGENFDPAPAPTLLYSKAKFLKRTKVYTHVETNLFV
jgi:hypothetical protein